MKSKLIQNTVITLIIILSIGFVSLRNELHDLEDLCKASYTNALFRYKSRVRLLSKMDRIQDHSHFNVQEDPHLVRQLILSVEGMINAQEDENFEEQRSKEYVSVYFQIYNQNVSLLEAKKTKFPYTLVPQSESTFALLPELK